MGKFANRKSITQALNTCCRGS